MPFDHFNCIAGFYDRAGSFSLAEPLEELLSLSQDQHLLDAGGGTGRVATVLRPRVRDVVIVDTSLGMLQLAGKKGLKSICAQVEHLPFSPRSFQRIIMVDALHHVKDQQLSVMALWDVLADGGRIVIVEPDIRKFPVKLIALGEKLLLMRSHFLEGEQIRTLFKGLNAVIRVIYDHASTYVMVEKNQSLP